MTKKYRLRENQHGNILVQERNSRTKQWNTITRYSDMTEYKVSSPIQASFRGPRDKAYIVEERT